MTELVLEGFAGPGGGSTGLRMAGFRGTAVGVEWDAVACRSAAAAGHLRVQADVAVFPLEHLAGRVDGVLLTPPCPSWSQAGLQLGKLDQGRVRECIDCFARGETPPVREWADERSQLTAEPMRWAHVLRPRWMVLEQVPAVLTLWQFTADKLRGLGYRTWTGVLSAEQYGTPQVRERAILIARSDGLPAVPPEPTHHAYGDGRGGTAALFGSLLEPVTMFDAIGWGLTDRPAWTVSAGGTAKGGAETFANAACRRHLLEVARSQGREHARLTVDEAAILQGFPPGYPWHGTATQGHRQVGDAVPPPLAGAILRPLIQPSAREVAA